MLQTPHHTRKVSVATGGDALDTTPASTAARASRAHDDVHTPVPRAPSFRAFDPTQDGATPVRRKSSFIGAGGGERVRRTSTFAGMADPAEASGPLAKTPSFRRKSSTLGGEFASVQRSFRAMSSARRLSVASERRRSGWIVTTEELVRMVEHLRSVKKLCLKHAVRVRDTSVSPGRRPSEMGARRQSTAHDPCTAPADALAPQAPLHISSRAGSADDGFGLTVMSPPAEQVATSPFSPTSPIRSPTSLLRRCGSSIRRHRRSSVAFEQVFTAGSMENSVAVSDGQNSPMGRAEMAFSTGIWGGAGSGGGGATAAPTGPGDTRYGGFTMDQVMSGVVGGRWRRQSLAMDGSSGVPRPPTPTSPGGGMPSGGAESRVITSPIRTCKELIQVILSKEPLAAALNRVHAVLSSHISDAVHGKGVSGGVASLTPTSQGNPHRFHARRAGCTVNILVSWADDCRLGAVSPATKRMLHATFLPAFASELTVKGLTLFVLSVADDAHAKQFTRAPDRVVEGLVNNNIKPWLHEVEILASPELGYVPTWLADMPELDDFMYQREGVLRIVFNHFRTLAAGAPRGGEEEPRYDAAGSQYTEAMVESDFLRMGEYGGWFPNTVSRVTVGQILASASCGYPRSHRLKSETPFPCLLFPEFCDAIVYLACAMFTTEVLASAMGFTYADEKPTVLQKVEAFFTMYVADMHQRLTGLPIEVDIEPKILRVPQIRNAAPLVGNAGDDVMLSGMNFCKKRGVHVRFGSQAVRCHTIRDDHVLVTVPSLSLEEARAGDVMARVITRPGLVLLELSLELQKKMEVRNNRVWAAVPKACEDFVYKDVVYLSPLDPAIERDFKSVFDQYIRGKPLLVFAAWKAMVNEMGLRSDQRVFQKFAVLRRIAQVGHDALIHGLLLTPALCSVMVLVAAAERETEDFPEHIPHILHDRLRTMAHALAAEGGDGVGGGAGAHDEWAVELLRELETTPTLPPVDAYDVLVGPQFVGVLRMCRDTRALTFTQVEDDMQARAAGINAAILPCDTLPPAVRKLIAYGYQTRPRIPPYPEGGRYIKRCWEILKDNCLLGHLWDSPGTGITADGWIPVEDGARSKVLSVHLGCITTSSPHFLHILHAYKTRDTLPAFREHLQVLGYVLLTVLPGAPCPRPLRAS